MRRVTLPLLASLVFAACGGGDDEAAPTPSTEATEAPPATTAPPTTQAVTSTVAPSTVAATTAPPNTAPATTAPPVVGSELVGRWAHYDVVAYEDGLLKTLIISYGFNDFSEVDGQILDAASFCYSEQRTDQPIQTSLSDAGTQAIRPPVTPVTVDEVDGTLRLQRDATPTPVGIRLDDPANESLPDDPNDPRIVDDDGDGNPGVTVTIEVTEDLVGELYIARREIFAYEALLTDPDTLEGEVVDGSEQLIIGANDPLFADVGGNWVQHPDLSKSPVLLRRVDESWDCDRLRAERDELFPPTPEVDW